MRGRKQDAQVYTGRVLVIGLLLLGGQASGSAACDQPDAVPEPPLPTAASSAAVPFVRNAGQYDDRVAFYKPLKQGGLYVIRDGAMVYALGAAQAQRVLREEFIGGVSREPRGMDADGTRVSSFRGQDRSRWRSNVPTFGTVDLGEQFPGIGVKLVARGALVEKLFVVDPGADTRRIRMRLSGATELRISACGELEARTASGPVTFSAPLAYQEVDGMRLPVAVAYELCGDQYGFAVAAYDRSLPLIIDPLLAATYLGGEGYDSVIGLMPDGSGGLYLSGTTHSPDFPVTPGAYDVGFNGAPPGGGGDIYLAHVSADLTTLYAATFVGGTGDESGYGLTLDPEGCVYLTGWTSSTDFPATPGAMATSFQGGERDIFVLRLNAELTALEACTYVGGSGFEAIESRRTIAIDGDGSICIAGYTRSADYPTTPGAYGPIYGGGNGDACATRLDADLTELRASTFLGAGNYDYANSLLIDGEGFWYVSGSTYSSGFPTTPGAYDRGFNGQCDGFVARLTPDLSILAAATFFGGYGADYCLELIGDGEGGVIVGGGSNSPNYPTSPGAYARVNSGGEDCIITRFDGALTTLLASTLLGGSGDEFAVGLAREAGGDLYVGGWVGSEDFPVPFGAFSQTYGGGPMDAYAARLTGDLRDLVAATYLGGGDLDGCYGITLDDADGLYVHGLTWSPDFPTTPAGLDPEFNGGDEADGFIALLDRMLTGDGSAAVSSGAPGLPDLRLSVGPAPARSGLQVTFTLPVAARARLFIADECGRIIRSLIDREMGPGVCSLPWDGRDSAGRRVASGVYQILLVSPAGRASQSVSVIR